MRYPAVLPGADGAPPDFQAADMQGGKNAGIHACRCSPKGRAPAGARDRRTADLMEFLEVVL